MLTWDGVVASGQGVHWSPQVPAWAWASSSMEMAGTFDVIVAQTAPSRVNLSAPAVHSTPMVCHWLKSAETDCWTWQESLPFEPQCSVAVLTLRSPPPSSEKSISGGQPPDEGHSS